MPREMRMKKGIYFGFGGDWAPATPRAPRSIRKRGSHKEIVDDTKVSAFDLLATVAGKLLQESESSSGFSNATAGNNPSAFGIDLIKKEPEGVNNAVPAVCINYRSREEKVFNTGLTPNDCEHMYVSKEFPLGTGNAVLECLSMITGSNHPKKVDSDLELANGKSRIVNRSGVLTNMASKEFLDQQGRSYVRNEIERQPESDGDETRDVMASNTCNTIPLVCHLDRKVVLPLLKQPFSDVYSRHTNDFNLGSKDDDEKCPRCYKSGTKVKAFRPSPRIRDRSLRKLLKSKYWKAAPQKKNCEVSDAGGGLKPVLRKRKTCYTHRRSESKHIFKRKLFDQSSVVTTDGGSSVESLANSSKMDMFGGKSGSTGALEGARLSIKSFRVPELFIEVPETATVGLLKRRVMEAVTPMLEGGLHVGVLLRGKKIKDDNSTLLQSGISNPDNLDGLGFCLEPRASPDPLFVPPEDLCFPPQPLIRSSAIPISDAQFSDDSRNCRPSTNLMGNSFETRHDLSSPTEMLTENATQDSKGLVAVQSMNMEALALAPISRKSRRSEFTQRRTRRPFSVLEVDALVQAVEELGTGRWRDIKIRSFGDANHRTYVDLKDKWKTLVHTAKISPHQRRGEPVPQELLDRVLSAHAYWSRHHDKQHGNKHSVTLKISGDAGLDSEVPCTDFTIHDK